MRGTFIQINEAITLINDANEATYYLVCGDNKALMIDSGWGYDNVMELAKEITALPVELVNTHGHLDHVYGNMYCERAWLHPKDFIICEDHFKHDVLKSINASLKCCPLVPACGGQIFDLGSLELEVIELPGHTPGSICLIDKKHRILFSGDALNPYLWAQLDESAPLSTYKATIEKVMDTYGKDFDYHLSGHTTKLIAKESINKLLHAMDDIINGKAKSEDYKWFGGISKSYAYGDSDYEVICYNANNI